MFTPKPKAIVKQVIELTSGLNAREASHTWMAQKREDGARFGSASQETFEQRRGVDRQRKLVARYADSQISQTSRTKRGDLMRAAKKERHAEASQHSALIERPPQVTQEKRNGFYPDFRPKL